MNKPDKMLKRTSVYIPVYPTPQACDQSRSDIFDLRPFGLPGCWQGHLSFHELADAKRYGAELIIEKSFISRQISEVETRRDVIITQVFDVRQNKIAL